MSNELATEKQIEYLKSLLERTARLNEYGKIGGYEDSFYAVWMQLAEIPADLSSTQASQLIAALEHSIGAAAYDALTRKNLTALLGDDFAALAEKVAESDDAERAYKMAMSYMAKKQAVESGVCNVFDDNLELNPIVAEKIESLEFELHEDRGNIVIEKTKSVTIDDGAVAFAHRLVERTGRTVYQIYSGNDDVMFMVRDDSGKWRHSFGFRSQDKSYLYQRKAIAVLALTK